MDISSNYLRAFYQLAQDKNFTKAANHLAITQSAFSQRILNFEQDLETTLFTREKGNIQLTDSGLKLLRYSEKLYKLQEEILNSIYSEDSKNMAGTIRVGGFSSILRSCVLPALAPLLIEHPKLKIATTTVELDELTNLLQTSKVDFIISNKITQNNSLHSELLGYEINVLVESKKHTFNGQYLDHDSLDVTTSSYFKLKPQLDKKNNIKRYLDDVYGLIDGVKLGMGRAVLPLHLIQNEKDLKVLYPKTQLKVPLYLLYYKNSYQTQLEQKVIDNLISYFRNNF